MTTLVEDKYYKDVTVIRKTLERIADALETQNRINASVPIMRELMQRYDKGKITHTDEAFLSGLGTVTLKYCNQLLNIIKDSE